MSEAHRDDMDLRFACNELGAAREQLRQAHALVDRHARREALKAAAAKLALAARAIDEVVERRDLLR